MDALDVFVLSVRTQADIGQGGYVTDAEILEWRASALAFQAVFLRGWEEFLVLKCVIRAKNKGEMEALIEQRKVDEVLTALGAL